MNRWTTFLKARLICSVIGEDGVETRFDELSEATIAFISNWLYLSSSYVPHHVALVSGDVFIQPTQDERNPVVYAVFTTAGWVVFGWTKYIYSAAVLLSICFYRQKDKPNKSIVLEDNEGKNWMALKRVLNFSLTVLWSLCSQNSLISDFPCCLFI